MATVPDSYEVQLKWPISLCKALSTASTRIETLSASPICTSRSPQQPNSSRSLPPLWRRRCSTWSSSAWFARRPANSGIGSLRNHRYLEILNRGTELPKVNHSQWFHCLGSSDAKNFRTEVSFLNFLSSPSAFKLQIILYALSRSVLNFCNLSMKSCSVGSLPCFSYHLRANSTIGAISPLLISFPAMCRLVVPGVSATRT